MFRQGYGVGVGAGRAGRKLHEAAERAWTLGSETPGFGFQLLHRYKEAQENINQTQRDNWENPYIA